MPPNNYNVVSNVDSIELLVPGEHHHLENATKRNRHSRTNSSTSFIHFRGPPQQREEDTINTSVNKLASQVHHYSSSKKIPEIHFFFLFLQALLSLLIFVIGLIVAGWMMDIYQVRSIFF